MTKLFYHTLQSAYEHELTKIKGSRFIGDVFHVETKEQAEEALQSVQKKYPDATHHCWARRYELHTNPDIFGNLVFSTKYNKCSDDGEPANTAGKPILQVLEKANIYNVLLVVTRYFWWTKLGVGWLIQAYSECAKQTLANAPLCKAEITSRVQFAYDFELTQIVRNVLNKYHAKIIEETYDKEVSMTIEINQGYLSLFIAELKDMSKGAITTKSV